MESFEREQHFRRDRSEASKSQRIRTVSELKKLKHRVQSVEDSVISGWYDRRLSPPGWGRMRCYVQFITTPTADTPGTLLYLHYDEKRYLIGQLHEGAQRASVQRGIALRKVSDILLTGRTEWANTGGMLGMVLSLADVKIDAIAAALIAQTTNKVQSVHQGTQKNLKPKTKELRLQAEDPRLRIYGAPNLNHTLATSRRFIFRTGMPIDAKSTMLISQVPRLTNL